MPATSRIPLRARRALRSTSRRTRSRTACGLGTVGMLLLLAGALVAGAGGGAERGSALVLQPESQPPHLPVERADLRPQPAHVAAGGQVHQVPGPRADVADRRSGGRLGPAYERRAQSEP